MSNNLYLRCKNHIPNIVSDCEVGRRLSDLPMVRENIAKRPQYLEACEKMKSFDVYSWDIDWGDSVTKNAVYFFGQHPDCELDIVDESGTAFSAREDEDD